MGSVLLSIFIFFVTSWGNNLEHALQRAKSENKLVLLYFSGSDWCGPCIQLKKKVFDSDEFNAFAGKHLVLVQADFPRKSKNQLSPELKQYNNTLAERYNNRGQFPLTVLLSAEGRVLYEWSGYTRTMTFEKIKGIIQTHQ